MKLRELATLERIPKPILRFGTKKAVVEQAPQLLRLRSISGEISQAATVCDPHDVGSVDGDMDVERRRSQIRFWDRLLLAILAGAFIASPRLQAQGKEIFRNSGPAVFIVRIQHNGTPLGSGSAFILNHKGKKYGVTNYHVVAPGSIHLERDGKKYEGIRILRVNDGLDVAIFDFPGIQDLPAVEAASYNPTEGERAYVLGYPGVSTDGRSTELRLNITEGLVSNSKLLHKLAGGAEYHYVQLTAGINPGNSGGPVFGEKGDVIGMATGRRADLNQVGWAVPCDEIVREIDHISNEAETQEEAETGVKERLASLVEGSPDLMVYWVAYAPASRSRSIDLARKAAERIRQSVILTRERTGQQNPGAGAFMDDMATRLRKDDFFFFIILQNVLSQNKNESLDGLKAAPHRITGLYLASLFMREVRDRLGKGDHKYQFRSFRVISLTFDNERKHADAAVEFKTDTDTVTLPIKLEREWGSWYLSL